MQKFSSFKQLATVVGGLFGGSNDVTTPKKTSKKVKNSPQKKTNNGGLIKVKPKTEIPLPQHFRNEGYNKTYLIIAKAYKDRITYSFKLVPKFLWVNQIIRRDEWVIGFAWGCENRISQVFDGFSTQKRVVEFEFDCGFDEKDFFEAVLRLSKSGS